MNTFQFCAPNVATRVVYVITVADDGDDAIFKLTYHILVRLQLAMPLPDRHRRVLRGGHAKTSTLGVVVVARHQQRLYRVCALEAGQVGGAADPGRFD